jgi:hypothetical protein
MPSHLRSTVNFASGLPWLCVAFAGAVAFPIGYCTAMISAVLFDLDETLLDRTTSLVAFLADQHRRFGPRLCAPFADWRDRFLALDARGAMFRSQSCTLRCCPGLEATCWRPTRSSATTGSDATSMPRLSPGWPRP